MAAYGVDTAQVRPGDTVLITGGTGGLGAPISQDAIQEFQVLTGGFSAEFGRAAGGIVNSVTKAVPTP